MSRSLRWRIQIWHAAILATVIAVFAIILYLQQRHARLIAADNELAAAGEVLGGQLRTAPGPVLRMFLDPESDADLESTELFRLLTDLQVPRTFSRQPGRNKPGERNGGAEPYFVIWGIGGRQLMASESGLSVDVPVMSDRESDDRTKDPGHGRYGKGRDRRGHWQFRWRDQVRETYSRGPAGTIVLVGRDLEPDLTHIRNLLFLLTGIGCTVFALGLTGGWLLSRRSVRPIREISQVAAEISEQDLSARIDGSEMDLEFEELSATLNDTFERLETAFEQQVQFTADASHELRTPLSVIRMHQELALSKERSAKEYRAALEICQRSTARMTSLVESLLSLSRLDADGLQLRLQEEDLAGIVDEVVQGTRLLAEAKQIEVKAETVPAPINGDRARLGQVLTNLITNAIAYSPDNGLIDVTVAVDGDEVVTAVSDSGEGIAEEHLPRIFDRFYRVESERSRDVGGSGLGLAICKAIVEAHGGGISVESTVGVGSVFSVRLPMRS